MHLPNRAVTTLALVMRLRGQYNTLPPYSQEKEENMEFKEVVKQIEDVEKKVDKVLKAARLERHEKPPMTKDMLAMILNYIVDTLAMVLGFAVLFLLIYYFNR